MVKSGWWVCGCRNKVSPKARDIVKIRIRVRNNRVMTWFNY